MKCILINQMTDLEILAKSVTELPFLWDDLASAVLYFVFVFHGATTAFSWIKCLLYE